MNRITDYKKLAEDITSWIRQYAQDNNIKSLVVGVSGGIDSAVVSTLCTMTGLPVYVCIIDIQSSRESIDRAHAHRSWLYTMSNILSPNPGNIHGVTRHLSRTLMEYRESGILEDSHVIANTKSRMRMMVLYETAALHQGIVVGTGNKVEDFGIGFTCKGGDSQVDISPIAGLYKTEVWELGKHLGIHQGIIEAAPTDDLFLDGRTDEQQIGATYEELEWAMDYDDFCLTLEQQLYSGSKTPFSELTERQQEVIRIYRNLNRKNQHKMSPVPIYKLPI